MTATQEIWILGANGRCGRAVASEFAARQHALVLVGRDETRLCDAAVCSAIRSLRPSSKVRRRAAVAT